MFSTISGWFSDPVGQLKKIIMLLPAVLIGLTVHEWAHAFAAYRCGDPTAKNMGRLTLNPISHLDPFGFLGLLFLGFGWAKPVPVNPRNFRHFKRDDIIVSAAGVVMNFMTAFVFAILTWVLYAIFPGLFANGVMQTVLSYVISINLSLMVFNLIPLYPLDGSRILDALLMHRAPRVCMWLHSYGRFILLGLLVLGLFSRILSPIVNWFFSWMWSAGYGVYRLMTGM